MAINFTALSTIESVDKYQEASGLEGKEFEEWKAIYFTLRSVMTKKRYGFWLADGLARQLIEIVEPAVKDRNGKIIEYPVYFPPIGDFYEEKRQEYYAEFDLAFIHATTAELLGYAKKKYNLTKAMMLKMNAERMAEYRQREGKADESTLLAEAQEREAKARKQAQAEARKQPKPKTEKSTIAPNLGQQYADWKASQGNIVSYTPPAPEVVSLDELAEQWGDEPEF